ncbi:hypothetical protein [Roseiconus lacunae]|uniref:Uncharacterized protein n=1 Tax=Roseiconus lacunae TaxID=2605694 RepID=A0ABT7PLG1_9BACT|nr:hypothetical protein [Roseiconus lacunae]MDM4017313.1 hypothetical protein [Roseiconus lacunae]
MHRRTPSDKRPRRQVDVERLQQVAAAGGSGKRVDRAWQEGGCKSVIAHEVHHHDA